jgi:eight-cysteine-cluster-containing protein
MKTKARPLAVLSFLSFVVFVSGCTGLDPVALAQGNELIKQFMAEHPNAQIKVTHYTAEQSKAIIGQIRQDCDNPYLDEKEYYKVNVSDPETNFYAVVWIEWSTKTVECVYKLGTEGKVLEKPKPEPGCESHASYKCDSGQLYWFDSCGNKQEKKEYCQSGCSNSQCLGECKSESAYRCYGDYVYWFDSCGNKQEKKEFCSYGCENGFCKPYKPSQLTCEQVGGYCLQGSGYCGDGICSESERQQICALSCPKCAESDTTKCLDTQCINVCKYVCPQDCGTAPSSQGGGTSSQGGGSSVSANPSTGMILSVQATTTSGTTMIAYECKQGYEASPNLYCSQGGVCCMPSISNDHCINGVKDYDETGVDCGGSICKACTSTGFCGISTYGPCSSDSGCTTGGCSGQICHSVQEQMPATTCEYKDCYNAKNYGMACKCIIKTVTPAVTASIIGEPAVQGSCQWTKGSQACTADAKLCPDGTYVSRDPNNNCEFYPCPGTCGNGICETGEADYCPPCVNSEPACMAPCYAGTCPQDCVSGCRKEGEFCGGIAGIQCCSGFTCHLDGTYPDAGGKCVKSSVWYRKAYWNCHDGASSYEGGETSCKSQETWRQYAEEYCKGRCSTPTNPNTDPAIKCGVNTFLVSNECSSAETCTQSGNSCCKGQVCSTRDNVCSQGLVSVFKGCDSSCSPIVECLNQACTDSDGGWNIYSSGIVTYGSSVVCYDRCATQQELASSNNQDSLYECFCGNKQASGGGQGAGWVYCPYGCSNGTCMNVSCPQYSPPSPGWCANGTIVSGGLDANGCQLPPKCILKCAQEGQQYSLVYTSQYPEHCCEGLTEWESGLDTRKVVNGACVASNLISGVPIGTCIKCGDGICKSPENLCNCPQDCKANQTCTDSDGGVNYSIKGYIIQNGSTYWDECMGNDIINEKYCDPLSPTALSSSSTTCPYGCLDGACVQQSICYPNTLCTLSEGQQATISIEGVSHTLKSVGVSSESTATLYLDGIYKEVAELNSYIISGLNVYIDAVYYVNQSKMMTLTVFNPVPQICSQNQTCILDEGKTAIVTTPSGRYAATNVGVSSATSAVLSVNGIYKEIFETNTYLISGANFYISAVDYSGIGGLSKVSFTVY